MLEAVLAHAKQRGLIGSAAETSVDATGLQSRHISRHFLRRRGRMKRYRRYPKMTILVEHDSYLIAGAWTSHGPGNDAPGFKPVVAQAAKAIAIYRLLGDGAFDAEAFHEFCRDGLGIPSTIIPVNYRGKPETMPTTRYRRQMAKRFPCRLYGRRWHSEAVISQHKRRLGDALTARTEQGRHYEILHRILTHDLMIVWSPQKVSTEHPES